MRAWAPVYVAILPLALSTTTLAQQNYTVTDLGTLPGGSYSVARHLNQAGHVVGWADTNSGRVHPFIWTPTGGMVDIANASNPDLSAVDLQAFGINSTDQIVGPSSSGAYSYANGTFTFLNVGRSALGVNDNGEITGFSSGPQHAFIWPSSSGAPEDIHVFVQQCGASNGVSAADSINNAGLVSGGVTDSSGSYHAFVYDSNTNQVTCIQTPGPQSNAGGINTSGQAVGTYGDFSSFGRPFIWTPGQANPLLLGTLNGAPRSESDAINDSGQIVGTLIWRYGRLWPSCLLL